VVEEIRAAGGQALADGYDVATAAGARALAAAALERWRRLDALVNNAGIAILRPSDELTDDECLRVLDTHAGGTLNMLRAVWPHMAAAGYGRIVNTAIRRPVAAAAMARSDPSAGLAPTEDQRPDRLRQAAASPPVPGLSSRDTAPGAKERS
jgi:NAD(P)-dependent dehydrogenase (short-subunit alcohol dehydrogenase family)